MSISLKSAVIIFLVISLDCLLYSQENGFVDEHHKIHHHRIHVQYGLVFIPDGYNNHPDDKGVFIASYAVGYSYRINHKWSIAIEANVEGGNYLIKGDIHRENVFIIAAVAGYELMPRWGLFIGGGIEIEKHENYAVMRFGTEYVFPIGKEWAIAPLLTFDHKVDYTSWEFAVGLSKSF